MKKLAILALCLLGILPLLKGQILNPGAGGAYQNNNIQLEWNIGEPIFGGINNGNHQLDQGFFATSGSIGTITGGCYFVCAGDTIPTYQYSVSGFTNVAEYKWTIVPSTAGIVVAGQGADSISIKFNNPSATFAYISVLPINTYGGGGIAVLSDTIVLDTACVWPGDINHDGIVSIDSTVRWVSDVLSLEQAKAEYQPYIDNLWDSLSIAYSIPGSSSYNKTLHQRPIPCSATNIGKNDWAPHPMKDWLKLDGTPFDYNGEHGLKNLKYADADGNGEIEIHDSNDYETYKSIKLGNITDSDVLFHHLNKKHQGNTTNYKKNASNADITIVHENSIDPVTGNNLVLSVYAGKNKPLKMRSIALKVYFDVGLYNRPYVEYANSHFGNQGVRHADYIYVSQDSSYSYAYIIVSRKDFLNSHFTGEPICNLVCDVPVAWFGNGSGGSLTKSSKNVNIDIVEALALDADSLDKFVELEVSNLQTTVSPPPDTQIHVLQPCNFPYTNMISFDVEPVDSSVTVVFADLIADGTVDWVRTYENGIGYKYFYPNPIFPGMNNLALIEPGKGYEVQMNALDTLITTGKPVSQPFTWNLKTGANLIGYLPDTSTTPVAYFVDEIQNNSLQSVGTYENCIPISYNPDSLSNTLDSLRNGYGYWVYMDSVSTLTKSNPIIYPKVIANCLSTPSPQAGAIVGMVTIEGEAAKEEDILFAFDIDGNPIGWTNIIVDPNDNSTSYMNLPIYGDDIRTTHVDEGIVTGEDFYIKIFDASKNKESDLLGPFSGWHNTFGASMPQFPLTANYDFILNDDKDCGVSYLLPTACIDFESIVTKTNTVQLKWTTASELNNAFFVVERSADGIEYQSIATVKGAGTTVETQLYNWVDTKPMSGHNYYRIQSKDLEGITEKCGTTQLIMIKNKATSPLNDVLIYPNPTSASFTIDYSGQVVASLILYNLQGEILEYLPIENNGKTVVNVSHLPNGVYIIRVNQTMIKKIIKID